MQKVFQWVRDKRHSSVRKWQSSSPFANHQVSDDLGLLNDFDKFVATSNPSLNNSDPVKRTYSINSQNNGGNGTPRTRRRNGSSSKKVDSRLSSKSFRSFPPVPIPKKSRRCKEILPRTPSTSVNNQSVLQVPELDREGSWRKLKRRLTLSKRKQVPEGEMLQDTGNQLEVRQKAGSSGSSNTIKDVDGIRSNANPNPMSAEQRKEPWSGVEQGGEQQSEDFRRPLIEQEGMVKRPSYEARPPTVPTANENSNLEEAEVVECSSNFVKTTAEASSTSFKLSSSSSSSSEEQEPYMQLVDVDSGMTTDRPLPPAYPLMDSAMTQSVHETGLSAGSMSVKSNRRKLRFKMPQASFCSTDSFRGIDQSKANSVGDMSSLPGHSSSSTSNLLQNSHELGISSLQNRRVTLQGLEYQQHNNLSPGRPETLERPVASTPTSPVPSPMAPRREIGRRRASLAMRRQSNVQLVQKVCGRRTSTTLIPLTSAQIHLVRSLWRQIYLTKGPTVIGSTVMHRLFFKCPKFKEQFRSCPMPRSFTNHDSFAKSHCKAMAELVDQVVETLDDLDNVTTELERVGKIHAQMLNGQLSSKLWNSVAETFIDCTLEWGDRRCRSETVRKAWALIIAFMIEKIKHGHLEGRKQLHLMRSTIAELERVALNPSSKATANIRT